MIHSLTMFIRLDLVVSPIICMVRTTVLRYIGFSTGNFSKNILLFYYQLIIDGYNQKIPILLEAILERMIHLKIDSQRFEILKTKV